jgi:hypothetical protein
MCGRESLELRERKQDVTENITRLRDVSVSEMAGVRFRVRTGICHLLSRWFLSENSFSTLKMEAICSSETSVDIQGNTRHYIPEECTVRKHRCENLKSYRNVSVRHQCV